MNNATTAQAQPTGGKRGSSEALDFSGALLFSRYAYPPNQLGYCGPDDAEALLSAVSEQRSYGAVRSLARQFTGAWPYLELIAHSNGIADPLDRRVVEAYWVGNRALVQVSPKALGDSLIARFETRLQRSSELLTDPILTGGVLHHNFHVFAIYPWLGLMRAGSDHAPMSVLDRCRIRWGTVKEVSGDTAVVESRPLVFDGWRLGLGESQSESVRFGIGGFGFQANGMPTELAVGDAVSLHWDWICDRLGGTALANLRYLTAKNLAAVNASPRPGPASVMGA